MFVDPDNLVRGVLIIESASMITFTLVRSLARYGSKKWALLTIAAYAAQTFYSQLSLLGTPITSRTTVSFVAGFVGVVYLFKTAGKRELPDEKKGPK